MTETIFKQGFNQNFHFLEDASNHLGVAKVLIGLSNSLGGELFFGIKKNGKVKGVSPTEIIEEINEILRIHTKGIDCSLEQIVLGRHIVVRIIVSIGKIKLSLKEDGNYYTRVDDNTIIANKIVKRSWLLAEKKESIVLSDKTKEIIDLFKELNPMSLSYAYQSTSMQKKEVDFGMSELMFLNIVSLVCINNIVLYKIS